MISERSARRGGSGEASALDLWELADRQHGPLPRVVKLNPFELRRERERLLDLLWELGRHTR